MRLIVLYGRLVLVQKKDGSTLDDSVDALLGSKYFCTLDMCSGYWQVAVDENDRHKTAFVTHKGYQFKVMPFGLTKCPATLEKLMETVLTG